MPKCECFSDPEVAKIQTMQCVLISQAVGATLRKFAEKVGICKDAMPYLMDLAVINMAVLVGIEGTAIEHGSQEAQWETERVLTGIEARLMERVREYYAEAQRLGLKRENMS